MAIAPRGFLVKSPSCDTPPKYGLLSSVTLQTPEDLHWANSGVEWEDFLCGEGLEAFIDLCPSTSGLTPPDPDSTPGPLAVDLGSAADFGVLAGSTVTNTGFTIINGDLGLSPGTSITGFPPGIVNGTIHQTDGVAAQAQLDLTDAYNDAAGRISTGTIAADLGGQILTPGVYTSASSIGLTGVLTLDAQGDPNAVWIFQAGSTLTTASASQVVFINGAQACNVFWQVGSSATLGTGSDFSGTILALTSITATTGATVDGRLLARNGAVTLDTNTVTVSTCEAIPSTGVAVTDFVKSAERSVQFCSADPFVVVGSYECPPVGRPAGEAFEIARKRLLIWESHQVEETLWTGIVDSGTGLTTITPSFAFGNPDCDILPVDINPAGALDAVAAISAIEEALGDIVACGGIIHVPAELLAYLVRFNLARLENGIYYSPNGLKIIAGDGYPGSGPANVDAAAGETWIFATGPLVVVRSNVYNTPENLPEAVDRNINNVTVRAERFYAIGFSCVLLAIRVCLPSTCE